MTYRVIAHFRWPWGELGTEFWEFTRRWMAEAPGPGHRARSYVVVEYDEWRALHGEAK